MRQFLVMSFVDYTMTNIQNFSHRHGLPEGDGIGSQVTAALALRRHIAGGQPLLHVING